MQKQNVFTLTSNSTITQFAFNSTTKELSFIASGPSGTKGYVNIYIPKTLISDISTLKTYIDGNRSKLQQRIPKVTHGLYHSATRIVNTQ